MKLFTKTPFDMNGVGGYGLCGGIKLHCNQSVLKNRVSGAGYKSSLSNPPMLTIMESFTCVHVR